MSGDKDYAQAPFVEVLTEAEFYAKYGKSYTEVEEISSTQWYDATPEKKDAFWLRRWNEIEQNYKPIQWHKINHMKDVAIDTTGALACHGGACEI